MKFILFSFVFLTVSAHARLCEVYGISDSPQKLDCEFPSQSLDLRCRNGKYYLNSSPVQTAYHEEVEEGPVPLVFKTFDSELKVLMYDKAEIQAVWKRKGRSPLSGTCF